MDPKGAKSRLQLLASDSLHGCIPEHVKTVFVAAAADGAVDVSAIGPTLSRSLLMNLTAATQNTPTDRAWLVSWRVPAAADRLVRPAVLAFFQMSAICSVKCL